MKMASGSSLTRFPRLFDVLLVVFVAAENEKRVVLVLLPEVPLLWLIPVLNLLAGHAIRTRKENIHAGLLCRILQEGDTLEDADLEGRTILKWILERKVRSVWTGVIFVATETSARIVWMRLFTFSFHKMQGNFMVNWRLCSFLRRSLLCGVLYWSWLRNKLSRICWMVRLLQWLLQKVEEGIVGFGLSCLTL